jgi:cellulose synthase operon protein C
VKHAVIVLTLYSAAAHAQYRPPPPTESQQLTHDADAERQEAAKRDAAGDKAGAGAHYDKAIALYEKALGAEPTPQELAAITSGLGAACVARRDYARAVKDLTPVHQAHPDDKDGGFYLGLSHYKLGHYAEALPLLEPLSAADQPEHFMVHYYLGNYGLMQRDGARAVDELEKFLKRRPAELAAGDAQIEELVGRGWLLQKRATEAKAAFGKAGGTPTSQLGIAAALELEGKPADALALVENLAKANAKNAEVVDRLARMHLSRGNLGRAAEVASNLVNLSRTPAALVLLGDVRASQKDWNAAVQQYSAAAQLQPKGVPALLGLGRALEQMGKHDQAIAELEKGGEDPAILAALGSANRRAGHYQKAIEIHNKLSKKDTQTLMLLGADHFAVGQLDEAINDYSAVLEAEPNQARARHFLVLALGRRAQLRAAGQARDAALFDLRRAYDLEPSEKLARSLAAVELAQQKYAEAETTLAKAASPEAQVLLGYALLGQKKTKEALALFEKHNDRADGQLGWALCKAELGEYEAAAKALASLKTQSVAVKANLPLVIVRLAFKRLGDGDVAGASRELQSMPAAEKGSPAALLAELLRALIAVENRQYPAALSGIRAALAERQPWFEPATRPVLEAYVDYRMGKLADARKQLAAAAKLEKLPYLAKLSRAVDEREAEQLYAQNAAGAQPRIEKLLKGGEGDTDLRAQHNLACARYRHGGAQQAVQTWRALSGKVPEAELNLGLHALQSEHDSKAALQDFRRYAAGAGARAGQAKEWVDRLQQLYDEDSK